MVCSHNDANDDDSHGGDGGAGIKLEQFQAKESTKHSH